MGHDVSRVVIGANWGDEGKGLMVDHFCERAPHGPVLNVRYNGGSQAGHTVVRAGARHVFHHFGAGSLQPRVQTYLAREFICNPIGYCEELETLAGRGLAPAVYADVDCRVTTPFDMMLNQMAEEARGGDRHGSCGAGIFETVRRSSFHPFSLRTVLNSSLSTERQLELIRDEWVPRRMGELGLGFGPGGNVSRDWERRIGSDGVIQAYARKLERMMDGVKLVSGPAAILGLFRPASIVFEGAQGLQLSESNTAGMPHLTPSLTGIRNPLDALAAAGLHHDVEAVYVTRAYATRHGRGPLPHEDPGMSYEDRTNCDNEWQGSIRFAPLDLDVLCNVIHGDLRHPRGGWMGKVRPAVAVTCLDQVRNGAAFVSSGWKMTSKRGGTEILQLIEDRGLPVRYLSFGPSSADVRRLF